MKNNICVVPARMGSSRFPGKPLKKINGIPMVGHVALRCQLEPVFDKVVVATCDKEIADYCKTIDVEAVMTSSLHDRATDRVEEAVRVLEKEYDCQYDSVTLVQGDEPMITPGMLRSSLDGFRKSGSLVTNLVSRITSINEFRSPNTIKVVKNIHNEAMYFTRSPIPWAKEGQELPESYKQVCIITFTRDFLRKYSEMAETGLEKSESVDMNRVIENGHKLFCIEIEDDSFPVDTLEDLEKVEALMKNCKYVKLYSKL